MSSKSKLLFSVGEVVKLKSGGPDMTVRSVPQDASHAYFCQWFAGKKLEQGTFPQDSLELAQSQVK